MTHIMLLIFSLLSGIFSNLWRISEFSDQSKKSLVNHLGPALHNSKLLSLDLDGQQT